MWRLLFLIWWLPGKVHEWIADKTGMVLVSVVDAEALEYPTSANKGGVGLQPVKIHKLYFERRRNFERRRIR